MRVVVTGSLGLVGRHVVAALRNDGHDVTGVDRQAGPGVSGDQIIADLQDLGSVIEALSGADAVVHAAAFPRPTGHVPADVFTNNTLATFNVVEACMALGVRRIIYASSFSVVGLPFNELPVKIHYLPLDEAHPCAPQDSYALSKYVGEEIVDAAVRRGRLTATSIRMPWVQTGESFETDIRLARKDPTVASRNLWAYVDARDAGQAFAHALAHENEGHMRVLVSAVDTFMEQETKDLVPTAFAGVEIRRALNGHSSLINCSLAQECLGFVAKHSWRDYGL
ncbi:MAG TPA: NAD(P)-dependent oxidoreductase [Acidimicrobiales bacterium]|nr:NAD(P)-dependent oxidoreductase [Acidimicrobiales bacterium]